MNPRLMKVLLKIRFLIAGKMKEWFIAETKDISLLMVNLWLREESTGKSSLEV